MKRQVNQSTFYSTLFGRGKGYHQRNKPTSNHQFYIFNVTVVSGRQFDDMLMQANVSGSTIRL